MTHLYELSAQYKTLTDILETGECDQTQVKNILKEISGQLNDKAESIGKLILSLNSDTDSLDAEIKRLKQRQNASMNKIEWLKNYLLTELTCAKLDKVKTPLVSINVRTNPISVNILNENAVPEQYRRPIPATWEVDKTKILSEYKSLPENVDKETGEITKPTLNISGIEIITDRKRLEVK